jgi:ankyrin repeat protein
VHNLQTGLSHLCSNGLAPAVDILSDVPEVDINLPDKEGNTPLIFAAQAGTSCQLFPAFINILQYQFTGVGFY